MDSLEKRLRSEAGRIEARVDRRASAEVRRRLDAVTVQRRRPARVRRTGRLVGAGAGLGLAAALLLFLRAPMPDEPIPAGIPELAAYQASVERLNRALPGAALPETALRRELELLGADYQLLQNRVREQLDPLL